MKTLTKIIIGIFLFFSIVNFSFSTNYGNLGKILDLETGIEELKLDNMRKIDDLTFNNWQTQESFENLKIIDKALREKFLKLYKDGKINYSRMNYIISNYDLFVYHINKLFLYKKIKEYMPNSEEVNDAIISNLTLVKSYFLKVVNTIDKD